MDLRCDWHISLRYLLVPAHTGGVDLREEPSEDYGIDGGPRPHGRGGFKAAVPLVHPWFVVVPAHTGGVDLRISSPFLRIVQDVPAHTGGVDLRSLYFVIIP